MSDEAAPAVNLEALPPALRELVRVLGMDDALVLVSAMGGGRISVPHKAREGNELALLLGAVAFDKLVKEYGGESLLLPKVDSYLRELRHEQVRRAKAQGLDVDEIAERTGYTRRHVFNILGGYADSRDAFTMDLFGGEDEPANEPPAMVETGSGNANNPFGLTGGRT
ncbi:hypothetical protein [Variovorax sp. DAIF25]|uniref:hypothetical protein n=1 Tax=Variovorax sp. DAIF25 TaxID=3080983 RepID=UPI003D6B27AB